MRSQLSKCHSSGRGDLWQLQVNVSEAQELSFLPATEPHSSKLEDLKDKAGARRVRPAEDPGIFFLLRDCQGHAIYIYVYNIYSIYVYIHTHTHIYIYIYIVYICI